MIKTFCIGLLIMFGSNRLAAQGKQFADQWEYVGVAISEPGYTVWGTSPVMDKEGKIHLFVARWKGTTVEPGWRSGSEIAHYVGEGPEGPFVYEEKGEVSVLGVAVKNGDESFIVTIPLDKE